MFYGVTLRVDSLFFQKGIFFFTDQKHVTYLFSGLHTITQKITS